MPQKVLPGLGLSTLRGDISDPSQHFFKTKIGMKSPLRVVICHPLVHAEHLPYRRPDLRLELRKKRLPVLDGDVAEEFETEQQQPQAGVQ